MKKLLTIIMVLMLAVTSFLVPAFAAPGRESEPDYSAASQKTALDSGEIFEFQKVESITLNADYIDEIAGSTYRLTAALEPEGATNKAVTWSSSDEKIATVTENGLVTILRYGNATITATAADGQGAADTCEVQGRFIDVHGSSDSEDADYEYWYKPVYWAAEEGITTGYAFVRFAPEENCTRRQMMTFLWRLAGCPESSSYQEPDVIFSDWDLNEYPKTSAAYKSAAWGIYKGIINGFGDGTFRPDANVTRKDVMIMIYRFAGKPSWDATRGEMTFTDVNGTYKEGTDTYNAICWAYNNYITNGYSNGDYAGQYGCFLSCKRKDIVTLLYRYNQLKQQTDLPDLSELKVGDSVEFGSYPQTEVVSQASDSGVYGKAWEKEDDYLIDESLYNALENLAEEEWDANGDATVSGNKYRRIKASDATGTTSDDINYYSWSSSDTYHYFKYEPIVWRVLEQNGSDVFLISEIALDDQMYNTNITGSVTWETSTIRSWLNGYDSSANEYGTDYSADNFIDTAFTSEEQSRIMISELENKDSIKHGTEGGNDTTDKIFLLSEDEVYGSAAAGYGFASKYDTNDIARQSGSSTYAKAMGTYADCENDYLGNCDWWIRSPGSHPGLFDLVYYSGRVYRGGQHANSKSRGIRPALRLVV